MKVIKPLLYFCLVSCLWGCSAHPVSKYNVTALQLYNINNGGDTPVVATTGLVAAKAYAMRLDYTIVLEGSGNADRDEVDYVSANRATTFMVYSLSDFDATHPARTLLNDYFLYGLYSTFVVSADSIQNQLANGNIATPSYTSSGTSNTSGMGRGFLVLMHPPAVLGPRSFVVNVGFADNTHISDTISVTLQ